ncbi:MAG TPA: hypothetical protein VEK07_16990 [Polyangiaceae bacterium]|nr:hypothetical protein [Polyangiaceae bacterium]
MLELAITCAFIVAGLLLTCSTDVVRPPSPSSVEWRPGSPIGSDASAVAAPPQPTIALGYASALETPGFVALGPYLEADARFFFPGVEEATGRDAVIRAHELCSGHSPSAALPSGTYCGRAPRSSCSGRWAASRPRPGSA